MKRNLLITILLLLFSGPVIFAQVTETFETATVSSNSFTNGTFTGNLTPTGTTGFIVQTFVGYGFNSSNRFLEHASPNACAITSTTTFRVGSLYLYPSSDGGSTNQTMNVSVTFTGKLGGVTQFTYTPPAADFTAALWSNTSNRGFSLVNFATPGHQNTNIDELVIDIGGAGNYIAVDNFTFTAVATPTITTSGTLTAFTACSGSNSLQQSFTVSASNLTNNLVITPPSGYEVSETSGSGFATSLSIPPVTGSVSSRSIFVRLSSTASGSPSGNIALTSTGATTSNVAASGTVNASPSVTLGSNPTVCNGATSAVLTYSAATNSPNQYSISWSAGSVIAGFTNLNNSALPSSPISITVPPGTGTGTFTGTLIVRNSSTGCASSNNVISVTVGPSPTITLGANPSVCNGTTSANLTYSGTTGTPNQYSIAWSAGSIIAGFTNVTNASLPASPLSLTVPSNPGAGTYSGTITVRNSTTGCSSTGNVISVTVTAPPTITLGANPSVCNGTTSANLTY
nr:hypothetical protein [Bacteroidia bacterium]